MGLSTLQSLLFSRAPIAATSGAVVPFVEGESAIYLWVESNSSAAAASSRKDYFTSVLDVCIGAVYCFLAH